MSDLQLTFADCAELVSAKVHPKNVAQETLYIGLEHIVENGLILNGMGSASDVDSQKSVFKKGDILFGKLRPYFRKVVIAPCDGICSTDIWVVRPKVNTDRNFLFYWMGSKQFIDDTTRASEGTKMPRAKWDFAARFKKPECENEKEIGLILRSLDKKIALNRQINQTLESMAQAIFKSWFVDFDPVKAKIAALESGEDAEGVTRAAMRAISGKTDDELDKMEGGRAEDYAKLKATAGLFPVVMQDSELGEVPEGWEVEPIGDVVKVVGGGTPSTKNSKFWDGGSHCWTTPKDLSGISSPVLLDTARKITNAGLAKISCGLLPAGTFLLSSRAPVGYTAIARMPLAVNQGYIAIPPGGRLSSLFLLYWTHRNLETIKGRACGTTFQEISKKNFRPIKITMPTAEILNQFDRAAGSLFKRIVANEQESRLLIEIRDALLPKLMSGEIRVK